MSREGFLSSSSELLAACAWADVDSRLEEVWAEGEVRWMND